MKDLVGLDNYWINGISFRFKAIFKKSQDKGIYEDWMRLATSLLQEIYLKCSFDLMKIFLESYESQICFVSLYKN